MDKKESMLLFKKENQHGKIYLTVIRSYFWTQDTSLYSILHTMNWTCNLRDDHSVFLQIQNLNNFTKNVLKVRIASFWFNWWLNQNFSVPHSINQCSCHCWLELDTSLKYWILVSCFHVVHRPRPLPQRALEILVWWRGGGDRRGQWPRKFQRGEGFQDQIHFQMVRKMIDFSWIHIESISVTYCIWQGTGQGILLNDNKKACY